MLPCLQGRVVTICKAAYMSSHQLTVSGANRNSFRGGKREDLGFYVRSKWEANYARYLKWLVSIGEIRSWQYEPDTFEFTKIKRGSRFYTPDFKVFLLSGEFEYHEVKGWLDSRSKTKLSRMKRYFPEIKVVLIDSTAYRGLAETVGRGLVENWE